MDYSIESYSPTHRRQVLELQRALWSKDLDENDRYFRWKYEDNPHDDDPILVLAVAGRRVIGMRAAFNLGWKVGGTAIRALGDAVVAEDQRGKGVLKAIDRELMRRSLDSGCGLLMNASAGRVVRRVSLASGWAQVVAVETLEWVAPRGLAARTREAIRRPGRGPRPTRALVTLDRAVRDAGGDASSRGGGLRVETSPRPEEMAEVVRRWGTRGRVAEERSVAHLAWRFSNPLCDYRFIYHVRDGSGRLDGYLVLQEHDSRHDTGLNIVDHAAESDDVLERMVEACAPALELAPVNVWVSPAHPDATTAMRNLGFSSKPPVRPPWVDPAVLAYPGDASGASSPDGPGGEEIRRDLLSADSWDLRMTASDFY